MPEPDVFREQRNSLNRYEIAAKREICEIGVLAVLLPGIQQIANFFAHQESNVRSERFPKKELRQGFERCDYAVSREIPSLRILTWRVDRFIPRSAAAPLGPATIQLLCARALRICWRSVFSKTL
jgi:hypothetical protein